MSYFGHVYYYKLYKLLKTDSDSLQKTGGKNIPDPTHLTLVDYVLQQHPGSEGEDLAAKLLTEGKIGPDKLHVALDGSKDSV